MSKQHEGFIEAQDVVNLIGRLVREAKSCFSCVNLSIEDNKCIKFGSQPPMKIIKVGCDAYEVDIPF